MEKYEEIKVVCSKCEKPVSTTGSLWIVKDGGTRPPRYLCPSCVAAWKKSWEIKDCNFEVLDYDTNAVVRTRGCGIFTLSIATLRTGRSNVMLNIPEEASQVVVVALKDEVPEKRLEFSLMIQE